MNKIEKVNVIKADTEIEKPERNLGCPQITEVHYTQGRIRVVVEMVGANTGERHILCLNPHEVLEMIRLKSKGFYTLPPQKDGLYA